MNTRSRISRFFAAAAALVVAVACAVTSASAAGVATGQTRGDRATQMLFDAVHTNDFAAAEAAVAAGANVQARDRWDLSAVELAIDKGYFRIAHFLVSVRNSRTPADEAVGRANAQTSPAPERAEAAPAKPVAAAPQPEAVPQPQKVVAQPQWPADKPNPFDPAAPAFGTAMPIIPAGAPAATADAAARTGDGPMLANDEAIRRGEAVR